ncbi:MAG: hypothetical protein ACPGWR_29690 [Ardenticatenaceae bacterium]
MDILEIIRSAHWHPHVGDPTLIGWATTATYLMAALLCAVCARRADRIFPAHQVLRHRLVWIGLAMVLLFLGFNKQLDLQSLFTEVGSAIAEERGWFESGETVKFWFIVGLGSVALFGLLLLAWLIRDVWRQYWLLLLGLLFVARFIVTRAAGFYHISLPQLSQLTGGIQINWLLELIGTSVIVLAALINLHRSTKEAAQSTNRL